MKKQRTRLFANLMTMEQCIECMCIYQGKPNHADGSNERTFNELCNYDDNGDTSLVHVVFADHVAYYWWFRISSI